jgi:heat shock protein HtpX
MKFLTRSILIVLALYGIVFAIGAAYIAHTGAPLWVALAFPLVIVLIQYVGGPWLIEWLMDICWYDHGGGLPEANRAFVERLCAERGLKLPRIGIIQSGTPNAFSFGRLRSDARVVVTTGLLEVLTPEEANAVLAHEIGHIEHFDFIVMTLASLAPLLLYQLYVWAERIDSVRAIAYSAYLCYLLSQYIVLLLNRTREYFADHYAAEVTLTPGLLSSALVKIAYGMVRADGDARHAMAEGDKEEKAEWRRKQRLAGAVALMGISNLKSGAALALSTANASEAAAVMRWDLTNPWARLYELSSTHPLTAFRVRELNRQAESMHQAVEYPLPDDQGGQIRGFPLEVFLWAAPVVSFAALLVSYFVPGVFHSLGIQLPPDAAPILLIFAGLTWSLRIFYRYRGTFQPAQIGTLLQDLEVSQMNPRAVTLTGTILGRGLPGAFWSPDFVLRDSTGMIFIIYRATIPLARWFFAVTAAENYIGQEVVIEGWFRRGLRPYIELSKLTGKDLAVHRSYSCWIQLAAAAVALTGGIFWLYPALMPF